MSFLDDVKKDFLLIQEKLKGRDNYLTSSIILAGITVAITLSVLIYLYFFTPKISQNTLMQQSDLQGKVPTQTPILTLSPTLTPTPWPIAKGFQKFSISNGMNPQLKSFTISEFDPKKGKDQKITLLVVDKESGSINHVEVRLITDNKQKVYPMTLTSGTNTNGEWSTTIITDDTRDHTYMMEFTAKNNKGQKAMVPAVFR